MNFVSKELEEVFNQMGQQIQSLLQENFRLQEELTTTKQLLLQPGGRRVPVHNLGDPISPNYTHTTSSLHSNFPNNTNYGYGADVHENLSSSGELEQDGVWKLFKDSIEPCSQHDPSEAVASTDNNASDYSREELRWGFYNKLIPQVQPLVTNNNTTDFTNNNTTANNTNYIVNNINTEDDSTTGNNATRSNKNNIAQETSQPILSNKPPKRKALTVQITRGIGTQNSDPLDNESLTQSNL